MDPFRSRKTSAALLAFAVIASIALPAAAAAERKVQRRVPPAYPELARRMHIGGTVRIEAAVSADGNVTDARTVSGNKMLAPAAEEAIRKWKFAPGPGPSIENINVDFEAND